MYRNDDSPKKREPVVYIQGGRKSFRNKYVETVALDNINIEINSKDFISITGPSGCGKSTLLHIIGLIDSFDSGQYSIAGVKVNGLSQSQKSYIRNKHVGFVFQAFNLIERLSVFDNIALPLLHRGLSNADILEKVQHSLDVVGLTDRAKFYPVQLSGGQQQRVAIARATVTSPDLLLLDEPTGNLDSKNGDIVMSQLNYLNRNGTTIVMVTHDSRYDSFFNRKIELFDGGIIGESFRKEM
ncbi:ABC transporter ATP-binding protein [Rheinheimera sp. SA_1]|uniref:ABC transporter ATP-binding protein n=1 Tax=Rheinheimera sp. SA_1 TaxID=1827365 RepID=UPI0007FCDE0D|nr:ABC transporter ATP-binding protein [Rheinheimera sp. SA_1]OBP15480.1 ABC transporter ATP-binding protein [Rheinheimera sp. SA_1]